MLTKKILLASFVTILAAWAVPQGAWAQAAIPTSVPTPVATPTPQPMVVTRTFHCSCSTGGQPVVWAGNVSASSYFQARQQAVGQCMAAIGAQPESPLISPQSSGLVMPTPQPPMFNPCSNCACN